MKIIKRIYRLYRPARFLPAFVVLLVCAAISVVSLVLQKLADLTEWTAANTGDAVADWAKRKQPLENTEVSQPRPVLPPKDGPRE